MKKNDIIELIAGKMVHQGVCLSEYEGKKVFIENCIPGERVRVQIKKIKRDFCEAEAKEIILHSPSRINPQCQHFGLCGGCKIQYMNYEVQLENKKEIVKDALSRIGKLKNIEVENTIGSDRIYHYRNKMEYSFSNKRWLETGIEYSPEEKSFALGLHIPNVFDKVLHLNKCYLQSEFSNDVRNIIGKFFFNNKISVHSLKNRNGLLKALAIRESYNTPDKMINLITTQYDKDLMHELGNILNQNFPQVTTFVNSISMPHLSSALSHEEHVIFGKGYIQEVLLNKQFEIFANTFFQTNTHQAEKLFSIVKQIIRNDKTELKGKKPALIDLFCGVGVIGIVLADLFEFIYGIEISDSSIRAAKKNAEINNITNCEFFVTNLEHGFSLERFNRDQNDVTVILDPPRAGVSEKTLIQLCQIKPRRIYYVSCNPSTQARDVARLSDQYKVGLVQPIDFFPHTYHIENLIVLEIL